jgi:Glycosyltransferase family 92
MPNLNGLQDNQSEAIPAHCQLWFDSQPEPVVVNVTNLRYTWMDYWGVDKTGGYEGHFLTCEIPTSFRNSTPSSVTLVEQKCGNGTNHLKVMNERPPSNETKTDFGICVRNAAFPFEDKSIRYVEWIELQLAMGVSQIYFYLMDVHPNIEKVLKYYEARGKVRVSYMTYPSGSPNVHGLPLEYQRQNCLTTKWELISLNDCYYRNMHKHKFLAMLDPDEVIMPKSYFRSFYELFDAVEHDFNVKRDSVNSFNFMNSYFLHGADHKPTKDIPGFLYMMQHVDRLEEYSKPGHFIKSFQNTANCLVVHNHSPLKCVSPWKEEWCTDYMINTTHAQLNHYRRWRRNEV